jgi:hypothetical protein
VPSRNITAWETGCHPGEDPDEADSTNTYSYSYSWELLEALGEDHIEDCRMFQITGAHNIFVEGVEADKVEITVYNDAGCSGGYELAKITTDGCKVVAMDVSYLLNFASDWHY